MIGSENVHTFLMNLNNQLYVPIFQRNYSWNTDEYNRLWEDIMEIECDNKDDNHFINTIIHKPQNYNPSIVGTDLLVDGQQRLTTILLLYSAICSYCKHNKNINVNFDWKEDIYYSVLVNRKSKKDNGIKLRLRGNDNYFLERIITELPSQNQLQDKNNKYHHNNSNLVLRCYNSFYSKLTEENIDQVFCNLCRLTMYDGEAEEEDDAQELFDSLNSTGVELNQFEQIRNYLLMSFDEEKQIYFYDNFWKPMENYFTNKELFNNFIHGYVRYFREISFKSIPKHKSYTYLKRGLHQQNVSKEDIIEDIYNCFLILVQIKEMTPLDKYYYLFKGIDSIGSINSTYAILFKLYSYYNNKQIDEKTFENCLRLLDTHLLRVRIAHMNSTQLLYNIELQMLDESNFYLSFEKMLFNAFNKISDSKFKKHILTTDFYSSRVKQSTRNILERIEMSFYPKGSANFEGYSIEHIMPQKLDESWKLQLGKNAEDIHNNHINDLGNLTLTAYNSEYSNELFEEKLEMKNGFKEDRLNLNKSVIKFNHWNEDTISERTDYLADKMIDIWNYPKVITQDKLVDNNGSI